MLLACWPKLGSKFAARFSLEELGVGQQLLATMAELAT